MDIIEIETAKMSMKQQEKCLSEDNDINVDLKQKWHEQFKHIEETWGDRIYDLLKTNKTNRLPVPDLCPDKEDK